MWSGSKDTLRASVDPMLVALALQSNPTITVPVCACACVCACTWDVPDVIFASLLG